MNNEEIFKYVAFAFVALFLIFKILLKKQPKEKTFVCARCKSISPHTERTIEAWRNNKSKFYCKACHAKWLELQPRQAKTAYQTGRNSGSGCLGFIVIFIAIPIGYFIF
jgi:hypothetical protein